MNSSMAIRGSPSYQMSHDKNFQFSGLFGLQIGDVGSVINFKLFLPLEYISVPILYKEISIFFLKLYLHYKLIWHALCLN